MDALVGKVRRALAGMILRGDKVLVAVSGGADSVALFHVLEELSGEYGFKLAIAHLDHKAREGSADDARFVSRMGAEAGVPVFLESLDVEAERSRLKTSFQETGRILRYRFLESVLQKWQGQKIALGHTADDQVETVLMNLLRGSGLKGLGGIPPVRGKVIRPLHDCFRSEVEDYLNARGLKYRQDPTNAQPKYLRNQVRQELIPFLEGYNPQLKGKLIENSRVIREEDEFLEDRARRCFQEIGMVLPEGQGVSMEWKALNDQPLSLQRRLIREAIRRVKGDLRRISADHVERAVELLSSPGSGKTVQLPGGLELVCRRHAVKIIKIPPGDSRILTTDDCIEKTMDLKIPGWTEFEEARVRFHAKLLANGPGSWRPDLPTQAFLDYDKTGNGILARFFRPGDRFIPLGMTGRKKVKSFWIDEKVPREERKSIPILTTRTDDIIWIYGQRISESYRVTDKTRNILYIEGVAS